MQLRCGVALGVVLLAVGVGQVARAQCTGDCNKDGFVKVNELIIGVNIALESDSLSSCPSFDTNDSGKVEINELIKGVNIALSSCPEMPVAHKCTFDEATDNSDFDLRVTGNSSLGSLVGPIAGAVDITCGAPGGNGKRACTCDLQSWTPVNISGIGLVCISSAVCPEGEMDCDGGNALGIDAYDSSGIGACTGHADCETQCDAFCEDLSKVRWRSNCDLFCSGGTRDGLPCICDQVGSSGCVGGVAGVDDCPGGSCAGKNNEESSDCQCQCVNDAAGDSSSPGDLRCNLGTEIIVVANPPCGSPPLLQLPPVCAPLSSQETTGFTTNANEGGPTAQIGPNTTTGSPETCANLDSSVTTGFTLATDIGFPDSTLGDIRAILTIDCE